jgi:hypothetical protein
MAIDDESRYDLFVLLQRDTSHETAAALMRHIPPTGWPDFATKSDIAMTKSDIAVLRAELDTLRHELRAEIQAEGTRMIRWTVSTMLAGIGVAATVTGVIASSAG